MIISNNDCYCNVRCRVWRDLNLMPSFYLMFSGQPSGRKSSSFLSLFRGCVTSHCIVLSLIRVSLCFSELDQYCEAYRQLKGMRTLEWKLNLGQVQVKIAVVFHFVPIKVKSHTCGDI